MLPILLKFSGVGLIFLAILHLFFGKRFDWPNELARLSLLNRQIFRVHCFFIAFTVGLMGVLTLFFTDALLERSALGKVVSAGLAMFWAARLFTQWFVYDPALWRGHRFNTFIHFLFTILWAGLTGVFGWVFMHQCNQ